MSDITLSSAVRSNLLSLQSTADLMSKTQERLATGLKVNSALDNPTNFFTASSLNSRANDLSRLLDGVSNATQTLEAADNGISAITKLVESAQATVRQAQQTSATVEETGTAIAEVLATSSTSDTSALTIAAGTAGTTTGTAYSAVDLSGGVVAAESGTLVGGATGTVDLSGVNDLTISVDDGTGAQTITIDAAAVTQYNANIANTDVASDTDVTDAELAGLINQELGDLGLAATATVDTGAIRLSTDAQGAGETLTIGAVGGAQAANSGLDAVSFAASSDSGVDAETADSITFDITSDTGTASITIDASALDDYDAANPGSTIADRTSITGEELAAVINQELDASNAGAGAGATASFAGGAISFASDTTGSASTIEVASYANDVSGGATGISDATASGAAGTVGDVTINGQTVSLADGDDAAAILTKFEAAATASSGTDAFTVSDAGGTLTFTGTDGNDLVIGGDADALTGVGLTAGTTDGTVADAAPTTEVVNPKRAEFISQYNEIVGQINELAEDASFNGVNLLDGDDLSVTFNEDGSSSLDIAGVTFDSAGLGLAELGDTSFDTSASIDAVLGSLDDAIGSLRSQASEFGSNLSIVETREDFTTATINTLETGAANLTLADTNEEGANLLALQTRQSLSSTALSLASQADQNVLRLF